jgi:3',5'-cyclic AMP phosphodiesterase CpdA
MATDLKAIIAHISDTHFNRTFKNEKPTFLSRFGAAPHDFKLIRALDTAFSEIPYQMKRDLDLVKMPKIDILLVTGDITTDGEENSFLNAQTYFQSKFLITKKKKIGLDFKENIFIVPGNHDCLIQKFERVPFLRYLCTKQNKNYNNQFEDLPFIRRRKINGTNFLFIGLDSNQVEKKLRNIAKGRVGPEQLKKIDNKLIKLRNSNEEYYNSCFKIAFLHHHLLRPNSNKKGTFKEYFQNLTLNILIPHELEDSKEVMDILDKNKIDMVVFGHQHISYRTLWEDGIWSNIYNSCAGTATQMNKKKKNSFKLYLFFSNKFQIIEYKIKKDSFRFEYVSPLPPPTALPNPKESHHQKKEGRCMTS